MTRRGVAWRGVAWHGMAWHGVAWRGRGTDVEPGECGGYNTPDFPESAAFCIMSTWLPIPGFDIYEASDDGRVRNARTKKERKPYTTPNG